MYLSRLFNDFTSFAKRNIISYSTIATDMTVEDGTPDKRRMRVIRDYDKDTGALLYSNIHDYNNDKDIENKYILTNRYDWYLQHRDDYEVRYIPLFVTNIKRKTLNLETLISNDNITKIYECSISTNPPLWNTLFNGKDISKINKVCGQLYIVPSNGYKAMSANYKSENIPDKIIEYNNEEDYVTCSKTFITGLEEYNDFTLSAFSPMYIDYEYNTWYWFKDEMFNSLFDVYLPLINIDSKAKSYNIMEAKIPISTDLINLTLTLKRIAFITLNYYERDYFMDCESKEDIIAAINEIKGDL